MTLLFHQLQQRQQFAETWKMSIRFVSNCLKSIQCSTQINYYHLVTQRYPSVERSPTLEMQKYLNLFTYKEVFNSQSMRIVHRPSNLHNFNCCVPFFDTWRYISRFRNNFFLSLIFYSYGSRHHVGSCFLFIFSITITDCQHPFYNLFAMQHDALCRAPQKISMSSQPLYPGSLVSSL